MVLIQKTDDFDKIFDIRMEIFHEELGISEDKIFDADDETLSQFLIIHDKTILGTFRLRNILHAIKIERMGILPEYRLKGYGRSVLKEIIIYSKEYNATKIVLDSIYDVSGFYEKSGFIRIGDIYTKAGLPHVKMQFDLT